MERAVWVFACAFALIVAVGVSSMSSATSSNNSPDIKNNSNKSFELSSCKVKSSCLQPGIKPIGYTSEMFLRKLKRSPRIAYA